MPKVMLRYDTNGALTFYIAKKDLEGRVVSVEFDTPERFGGRLELEGEEALHIEPMSPRPRLPLEVRAKRAE
ncbi:MAG: putative nitrogen fixation protein NifT [Magnetococcus sp. WYHC-3]